MKSILPCAILFKECGKGFNPFLKNIKFYLLFFIASFFLLGTATSQIAPVLNPSGGFHIDGNLKANLATAGIGDWVPGPAGAGGYVINNDGTVVDPTFTFVTYDPYNTSSDIIFSGGNKVNDNPNVWTWSNQSAPDKNDINRGLIHLAKDANDDVWLMLAGDRLSTNGTAYIDFELLQNKLTRNTGNSGFTSAGPDGGRTVNDLLITVEYNNGGGVSNIIYYRWLPKSGGGFSYQPIPAPGPLGFAVTNPAVTDVPFQAFGSATYNALQFVEAAVNISQVINVGSNDACQGLNIQTIFVKTKASSSDPAELKDFIEPIQVSLAVGDVSIQPVGTLCVSSSPVTLVGTPSGGTFSGTGVSGNQFYPNIAGAGTHTITYTKEVKPGCVKSEQITITVDASSVGGNITGSGTVCASGNSGTLTLSGYTGTIVKWQSTTDGQSWADIANTTATLSYSNLTQTTTYRAVVKSGVCDAVNSGTATVTVNLPSVGGSIAGGGTVCASGNSGTLTLSGYTGTIIKWQSTTDGQSWTDIANSSATLNYSNLTQTTTYRAVVKSGVCDAVNSGTATVTVNPASVGGSIAGGGTVCASGNSGTLTLSGYTGTIVKWQSTTNGSIWTDIVNTTATLNYSNLTQTTTYRAVVKSGVCDAVNSGAATVTVNPASVGGSIAGGGTVCASGNSGTLTLSGYTGTIVKWQSTTDGQSWTDITNTSATLNYSNLTQTTTYRAVVKSGVCDAVNSGTATVAVDPASVGGSVTGGATVCAGSNSGTLTLSGNVGTIVRWQSSTNGGSTWSNIANTTAALNYSNLTQTTTYRAVVKSGVCGEANSSPATVTVVPQAIGGAVTPTTILCDANPIGSVTVTGYTGTIIRWEKSTDGQTWTPIANTSSTLEFGILTQRTYFRAVVSNGYCDPVYSIPGYVIIIGCGPEGNHCTYTQGFYGNVNGLGCSGGNPDGNILEKAQYKMLKAFELAATTKVVFGRTNIGGVLSQDRAFTLFKMDITNGNIFKMLPGGGPSGALGIKPGGSTYGDTYEGATYNVIGTWDAVPIATNGPTRGKIKNTLLAQTITLFFNMNNGTNMAGFGLHDTLYVKNFDCLSGNAIESAPVLQFGFPQNVISYLGNNGGTYSKNVSGLYKLANDVLGGVVIPGITATDLTEAVDKLNNTFDGCRSVVGYYDIEKPDVSRPGISANNSVTTTGSRVAKLNAAAYPNPYTDKVRFAIESPVSGQGSLDVFNMLGQKVQTVYQGYVFAGRSQYIDYTVPATKRGNLIYILKVGDQQFSGKLINPKH